jgi:hypothetical protein
MGISVKNETWQSLGFATADSIIEKIPLYGQAFKFTSSITGAQNAYAQCEAMIASVNSGFVKIINE